MTPVVIPPPYVQKVEEIRLLPSVNEPTDALGKIAYIYDGDVWVKSLNATNPRRLTAGNTFALPQPRHTNPGELHWSPSGEWLLVGEIVLKADGTAIRTKTGCLAWSPIIDELACFLDGDVVIENADGSERRTLKQGVGTFARLLWKPDGSGLVFTEIDRSDGDWTTLWTVERDGTNLQRLVGSDRAGADQLIPELWTPDGRRLLFHAGVQSASILADGMELTSVAVGDTSTTPLSSLTKSIHVKPDFYAGFIGEDRLIFTDGGGRLMGERKRIAALDIDSGTITPLTSGASAILPALSPDGLRIAYTAGPETPDWGGNELRDGVFGRRIWLMDADGSNQRRLTDGEDYREERPQWTADGRIVFVRVDADGLVSLWQMRPGDLEGPQIIETIVDATVPKEQVEALQYGYYGYVNWPSYFAWWQPH